MNFLTPEQIAKILQINKMTVYREVKRGNLKAYKFGKEFRIRDTDFEKYLHSAYQAAQQSAHEQRSCITPAHPKTAREAKTAKQTVSNKTIITQIKPSKTKSTQRRK